MIEDIVCNKSFVIGLIVLLIIAIIVIAFLYFKNKKKPYLVENMQSLDLIPLDNINDAKVSVSTLVEKKNDSNDSITKSKNYIQIDKNITTTDNSDNNDSDNNDSDQSYQSYRTPVPLDPRPDLGNCVPCICPGDPKLISSKNKKNKKKNNKK